MSRARLCSVQRVMSLPARLIRPVSTRNGPATALSRVDFPEPFEPMMMRNEPAKAGGTNQRFADNDAGQPPPNHADTHLHIGDTLVLGEHRATQRDQPV